MRNRFALYQEAMRTVCTRRQAARVKAQDAAAAAYAAVPGLAAAQDAFRQSGIAMAMEAARGGETAAARARMQAAKAECDRLLRESGRGPDSLEPKYTCPLCQDTGAVAGKTCTCVYALMRKLRRQELMEATSLSLTSFDTLRMDYYPNEKDPLTGQNIRQYMKTVFADLRAYAEDFDLKSADLFLTGNAGLGKTHAALAVAGTALEKGYDVIYMSSPEFFSQLENAHFSNDGSADETAMMEAATQADLLILDDLGTELVSSFTISAFYSLLNSRLAAKRPTILTSNITSGVTLEKRYTEKISSRIAGFVPFLFLGKDIRQPDNAL